MRPTLLALAVALSAVAPAVPAGAAVNDFRLPEDRPQQQPQDIQGPVAPDVPASRRIPAPSPTPGRTETPVPAATATPVVVPGEPAPRPTAGPARAPVVTSRPTAAPDSVPPAVIASEPTPAPTPGVTADPPAITLPRASVPRPTENEDGAGWPWWLLVVGLVAMASLAAAIWAARRRANPREAAIAVPEIERPRVPATTGAGLPPAVPAPAEPLQVSLEPLRLSLTLMNATLAYRLEVANRGAAPLVRVAISADMIAAHASLSREEQLAGPSGSATVQPIDRLEPGETRVVEGEFRLPFPQIVPIRQGSAALLLPLARFRVEADGASPLVKTFVVGLPGQGSGLQPFRLDQGPRVFPRLAQHAFA